LDPENPTQSIIIRTKRQRGHTGKYGKRSGQEGK